MEHAGREGHRGVVEDIGRPSDYVVPSVAHLRSLSIGYWKTPMFNLAESLYGPENELVGAGSRLLSELMKEDPNDTEGHEVLEGLLSLNTSSLE